jgi:hypothetical protein
MAVIVPTVFSVEMNQMSPQTQEYRPVAPQAHYGRARRSTFFYALAGTEAANTTIIGLCIVPKNARIAKSDIWIDGSPSATSTFDIGLAARDGLGVLDQNAATNALEAEAALYEKELYEGLSGQAALADTGNLLGSFAPAGAAASGNFADTIAHYVGYVVKRDCILIATVKTANVTIAANIFGYVNYVVD